GLGLDRCRRGVARGLYGGEHFAAEPKLSKCRGVQQEPPSLRSSRHGLRRDGGGSYERRGKRGYSFNEANKRHLGREKGSMNAIPCARQAVPCHKCLSGTS